MSFIKIVTGAVLVVAATGIPALAQDKPIELPVVQDRAPLEGYGKSKADVLGIRFGEAYADVLNILKRDYPNAKVEPLSRVIELGDSRGNRLKWQYDQAIRVAIEDQTQDFIDIWFTSKLTGGRVYRIDRKTRYPQQSPADMKTVRKAIIDKLGEPTLIERYDHQNRTEIVYTWEKRPVQKFGEQDVQKRTFNSPDPANSNRCLYAATSSAHGSEERYQINQPGARKGNPGWDICIGGMKFILYYGPNPNTVATLEIKGVDYDRSMHDARLLDETLAKMMAEKANAVRGTTTAPKL